MLIYIHKIYKYIKYIIKSQSEEPKRDYKNEETELKKNKSDLEMKNTVLKVTKITQKIQWQNNNSKIEYKNEESFWVEIGSNYSEGHFISWNQENAHLDPKYDTLSYEKSFQPSAPVTGAQSRSQANFFLVSHFLLKQPK